MTPFANEADYELCRQLHRRFGTTYYASSRLFPPSIRRRVHALYGFVRVPDEWVDNPDSTDVDEIRARLQAWRAEMDRGVAGTESPTHPVLRAFCDVARETRLPLAEAHRFIDAMAMDLETTRYATYRDLENYMAGSAAAVGVMMTCLVDAPRDEETLACARALGNAMQLTNFLRDVAEDAERGRIYLPQEDLERFGVSEDEVMDGVFSDRMESLIRFEIARARNLYRDSHPGIRNLSGPSQSAVLLARVLYSRILDRIEMQGANVFVGRARTTTSEKLFVAGQVLVQGPAMLDRMERSPML